MRQLVVLLIGAILLLSCTISDNNESDFEAVNNTNEINSDCTFNGFRLYGKIKFVESFPDIKVQVVDAFPDLKVQIVNSFPDDCGQWQIVESFPDVKVQIVESFPDIKIKYVDAFPGLP